MNINFHILTASGRLNSYIQQIQTACNEAKEKIGEKLSIKDVDIVIVDNPYFAIPETGVGGHTHNSRFIIVSLDPESPNFQNIIHNELIDTFAHELHHAARLQTVGYGETLLEAMVSEGLADHFASEVTKRKDIHPWDKALTPEQIPLLLEKAKKEYKNKSFNHQEWFFGSKKRGVPRWTGYTLGFMLIKEYLKINPNKKASELYSTKAEEFVKHIRR